MTTPDTTKDARRVSRNLDAVVGRSWSSGCGRVRLLQGDCREIIPLLSDIDACITDPPYGIAFQHSGGMGGLGKGKKQYGRTCGIVGDETPFDPSHLLNFPKVVLMGANHFARRIPEGKGDWLVWDKSCGMGANTMFRDGEFIWSSTKTARLFFRLLWQGMTRGGESASSRSLRLHVSQKPVELMLWLLDQARVGLDKTVLDPYMGSGTTGVACVRTGRRFVGIEIDAEHFENARKRIARECTANKALSEKESIQ
jgi:site-specific DNA-methyltransferase (adenine-specific)